MNGTEHVAHAEGKKKWIPNLVQKQGKKPLGRIRHRWHNGIKNNLRSNKTGVCRRRD
jgi:hypothetical protein